ncbi:RagB/SusD family nutrient uptake outer membrane protein [Lutibacter sp. HS1-25]|uniref:RagB/SusD family nutrient uptake outer membrane protein n=1 Tax=Lutibacter sp. HS1-25 TaxID=2485000 RepID=UPI0013E96BFC|nr:RagB/SusD family nutrient uptake outer membrane protein [Lutibacter sp. HS1-25]
MKNIFRIFVTIFIISITTVSCEDYLDVPPEADITENDVFGSYYSFTGFLDQMYRYIIDYNSAKICVAQNFTGETIAVQGWNTAQAASTGNYWNLVNGRSNFNDYGNGDGKFGIWNEGWAGIRRANIALEKLDLLIDATPEEKNLIEGQAYFFRAFFHWEILRAYGSIPYINSVLAADGDLQLPRFYEYKGKFDYQACTEYLVEDLEKAAALLPEKWDSTDEGRATKGAAFSLMAKALLYAGSPLMNEFSRNSATFDTGYMSRAANAAAEVLKLADKGVYALVPFDNYLDMFARTDGLTPTTTETIFQKIKRDVGSGEVNTFLGRLYMPHQSLFGGNAITEAVTQNFVDIFEMADGTKYIPGGPDVGGYDFDNNKRWNNRDPRFRKAIYVDRDMAGIHPSTIMNLYDGGSTLNGGNTLSPYIVHKMWPLGVNKKDAGWNNFRYVTPHLRLAEIYLIYAEAAYQATKNATGTSSNYSMTALAAVNKVRARAGQAQVTSLAVYNNDFQSLVRYERDVELCFEGHRWYDMRRWKIKPDDTLWKMSFDKNYTYFNREIIQPFIFDDRNYWMPLPRNLTSSYDGFPQNAGW